MNDDPDKTLPETIEDRSRQVAARGGAGHALGIRGRLFLAFCAMAVLTVVAGGVAWFAFLEIGRSVDRITSESVPSMATSLQLAEKSAEFSAMAPALMASADQAQRRDVQKLLSGRIDDLDALIERLDTAGVDPAFIDELRGVREAISGKLEQLDASVRRRLELAAQHESLLARLSRAQTGFEEVLEPMVDDAVFDMIITSERLTARSSDAITELIDHGVLVLNDLMSISAESHLVAGLLAETARVSDPTYLQPIRERFTASAESIGRSLRALPDSANKLKLQHATGELLAFGSGPGNVFEQRERELRRGDLALGPDPAESRTHALVARLREVHRKLLETLVPIIDDAVFDLVVRSEELALEGRERITRLVDGGVNTLHLLLAARAHGNLAAGLLTESTAVTDSSMLQPLRERFTAARSHVQRNLHRLPSSVDDSRLREAASSLLAIGTGADSVFALRQREVAEIARSQTLLEASRSLATRLHDEVAKLVASARSEADRAARDSADSIRRGKLVLAGIVAVSVVGAAMIMFFYVARRVIRPVQSMTRAMNRLAGGDTSVDIPAQDNADEVGDMAKALKVFRDTAVEVQETNLREVREARRRLIEAIESMSEGLSLYDAEDRLVVCNTRYRKMLYPGRHDLVTPGTTYETIVREAAKSGLIADAEDNVDEWVQRRLERHREPGEPHVQQRTDGRWIRVDERKTEDGGTVAVYTDITEDREREEELREAKEQAERALEELTQAQQSLIHAEKMASLGQLTAGVAHEIKNPLNFVKNFAETSQEVADEIEQSIGRSLAGLDDNERKDVHDQFAALHNFLKKISEHGRRADAIVRNMLAHAREGSDEMEPTDLNSLVEETLALTYHSVRAEHGEFSLDLRKDLDPDVGELAIYPQEITRVLINLIGNACYALQKRNSVERDSDYRPVLTVCTRNLGERVEVRIRDNGTGIPESVKSKIFDPFYTTKPTGEGTGLGLSLSYETVVQQHRGDMAVDSKEGEYTEFVITLPRTTVTDKGIAEAH